MDEGDYPAKIGKLSAKKMMGVYEPWVRVTIPFNIKNRNSGKNVTVNFMASCSLNVNSRLFPIVKGILGKVPKGDFKLRQLEGKKVTVSIKHWEDKKGNVWENVVAVRQLKKKK